MQRLIRLLPAACWLAIIGAYVAAILPQQEAPNLGAGDKVNHMVAFFTITLFARLAYRQVSGWRLLLLISAFGAFIELSQALPVIGRDAELADWIADTVATLAGLAVAWPLRRRVRAIMGEA